MLEDVKELIEAFSAISPNGLIVLALVIVLVALLRTNGFVRNRNQLSIG